MVELTPINAVGLKLFIILSLKNATKLLWKPGSPTKVLFEGGVLDEGCSILSPMFFTIKILSVALNIAISWLSTVPKVGDKVIVSLEAEYWLKIVLV